MAIPVWPAAVPHRPDTDQWGGQPFRAPLASDMEGGNTRNRRRPGDDVATIKWGKELSPAEMAVFMPFIVTTLLNGALRFTMPVTLNGSTYETRVVQIVAGSVQYAGVGGGYVAVSFSLLIFPAAVTS